MKTRVQIWKAFAMLMVLMFVTASCESNYRALLKNQVKEGNKDCPVYVGEDIELSRMAYDDDANLVQFYYTIDDYNFTVIKNNLEVTKSNVLSAFYDDKDPDTGSLIKLMTKANAGLQLIYMSSTTGDEKLEITITPEEIQKFIDNPEEVVLTPEQELDNIISMEGSVCPYEMDEGLIMNRVYVDGDDAVYECLADETLYDIDQMRANNYALKESIRQGFNSDPTMANAANIFAKNNKNLVFRYKGDRTGKTVDVVYTAEELRNVADTAVPVY